MARNAGDLLVLLAFLLIGVLASPVLAEAPTLSVVLAGGVLLVVLTALRPAGAVVGYIALGPLLAGLDRGTVVPLLRLNEVLFAPVLAGLTLVMLGRWSRSRWRLTAAPHALDVAVVAVAVTGSLTGLVWMYARGREITADDLFYALTLWKLAALYTAARLVLRDVRAVRHALTAILLAAGLMGVIGVLQAVGVGPVIEVLRQVIPPAEGGYDIDQNRATSTLGNPIAYGDVMIYAAVAAAALALQRPGRGLPLWSAAAALALCALASGQVSILLGLVTAGIVFALVTRRLGGATLTGAGFFAIALLALQPVLAARLEAADPATGLPQSWTGRYGRLENLQRYFWPRIGEDYSWLFGVRTAARVPGPFSWREWIYIESGYTWILWTGGLVLLVAVLALLAASARTGRRLMRSSEPVACAMGTTLVTLAGSLAILLLFDPHLTFRGASDILFVLLALGANLETLRRRTQPELEPPRKGHVPALGGDPVG